jgi:ectoine hydroxylase-related dioxygenase (phytanoyl-CoA dioxygenase family)
VTSAAETAFDRITEAEVEAFAADGAVCLRGIVDRGFLDTLARDIEAALATPGPNGRRQSPADDPGFFYTDYFMWHRLPAFRDYALNGPGGGIAARLLRSGAVNFFYDGLFVKEPGTAKASDWHQDQPYYPVDGRQVLIIWTPLDPAPAEVALQVVRVSHLWGRQFTPVIFKTDVALDFDDRYETAPDVEAAREDYDILSWDVAPGDVIAFQGMAFHGARGNPGTGRRRAFSTTWLGDDAVFAARPGELEPHFRDLDYPDGTRLVDEAVFPKVW